MVSVNIKIIMKVQNFVVDVGGKQMINKNGVKLDNLATKCADDKKCTCHYAMKVCSVCKGVGCVLRNERL